MKTTIIYHEGTRQHIVPSKQRLIKQKIQQLKKQGYTNIYAAITDNLNKTTFYKLSNNRLTKQF